MDLWYNYIFTLLEKAINCIRVCEILNKIYEVVAISLSELSAWLLSDNVAQ